MGAVRERVATLYDTDFAAWAFEQAESIRRDDLSSLDRVNLIEELESMGRQQQAELTHRLAVLLAPSEMAVFQPTERAVHARSWQLTMKEQRLQVGG